MKEIPFNGNIFISNLLFGDLDVLDSLFWDILRNVLPEIFNGIVISDSNFFGDCFNLSLLFVFNLFNLFGDPLNFSLIPVL
jgi:hypothetical protein